MGGSSQPAGYSISSGPTVEAAQAAAQAQESAAQQASQIATMDTQSAIQSLMGEYGTALTYANPSINTGNQAEAQMNYMLGLPAVSPGAAPVAPTAPTMAQAEQLVSPLAATEYVRSMSSPESIGNGETVDVYGPLGLQSSALPMSGGQIDYAAAPTFGGGPAGPSTTFGPNLAGESAEAGQINADAVSTLAQPLYQNLENQYQNAETTYNQQNAQYQQQQSVYNTYNAMGQATPADINNIVSNLPGFQFTQQQGLNSIQNAASASGMLNSGSLLRQLDQYGQGLSSQYYNNYLSQLGSLAGMGQQATNTAQQGAVNTGNTAAGLYNELGNTQANAYLAAGQAQASSYLSPAANQQSIVNPYGSVSTSGNTIGQAAGLLGSLGSLFGGF